MYTLPPWMYQSPWNTPGPSNSLRSNRNYQPSSPIPEHSSSPVVVLTKKRPVFPLVSEWLAELDSDETRGQDGIDYAQYLGALREEGIFCIDDLVDYGAPENLQKLLNSSWGVANRLVKYAKQDIQVIKGSMSSKKQRK